MKKTPLKSSLDKSRLNLRASERNILNNNILHQLPSVESHMVPVYRIASSQWNRNIYAATYTPKYLCAFHGILNGIQSFRALPGIKSSITYKNNWSEALYNDLQALMSDWEAIGKDLYKAEQVVHQQLSGHEENNY